MKTMDGISVPDMTITEEEFEAAGGLVRLIDGKIFLGKTDAEKASEGKNSSLKKEACGD